MIDISFIINLHREHTLLFPSVRSAAAASAAARSLGASTEILLILDNPDAATREYVREHEMTRDLRHIEVGHGDLGLARNAGAASAQGRYAAFLDGDDLVSENWLTEAWRAAESERGRRQVIWHPETNLVFGDDRPHFFAHVDMDEPAFELDWIRIENYWTALSFGERGIYLAHPYQPIDLERGTGYEDWSWNCQTIAGGIVHKTVTGTIHFVRRKPAGSLLQRTKTSMALPDWGRLFSPGSAAKKGL